MFFNDDGSMLAAFFDGEHSTVNFGDERFELRWTSLEDFFDTRKTHGDVRTSSHTTSVEGTHGQLSSWFTNSLRGNNTNGLSNLDHFVLRKVYAIAAAADTVECLTGNSRSNTDMCN